MEKWLAVPDSPDYVGQMVAGHERIPSLIPEMGHFDPEDLFDVDEEAMYDDLSHVPLPRSLCASNSKHSPFA